MSRKQQLVLLRHDHDLIKEVRKKHIGSLEQNLFVYTQSDSNSASLFLKYIQTGVLFLFANLEQSTEWYLSIQNSTF